MKVDREKYKNISEKMREKYFLEAINIIREISENGRLIDVGEVYTCAHYEYSISKYLAMDVRKLIANFDDECDTVKSTESNIQEVRT